VAGLALVGCGGDDFNNNNNTPDVTSEVPASASASVGGFIEYLMKLVVASADMLEPVDISTVTAPKDDTGEPTALP
ncbi:MAG: hypothetical protein ABIO71_12715, partial [Caldimonas sp.]